MACLRIFFSYFQVRAVLFSVFISIVVCLQGPGVLANCPPGYFLSNSTSPQYCSACPSGYYQTLSNQTFCVSCDAGTFSLDSTQATRCTEVCPQGYYCPGASNYYLNQDQIQSRIPCPAGTYQMYAGAQTASSCQLCLPGTYQASIGQSSCALCEPGTYQTSKGAVECNLCPPGTYQKFNGETTCTLCDLGYYVDVFQASQCNRTCTAGSYCSQLTSNLIHAFPGLVVTLGVDVASPISSDVIVEVSGSSQLIPCPLGTYQPDNQASTCQACDTGNYSTSSTARQCAPCLAGNYCIKPTPPPFTNDTAITPCPCGFFQNLTGQSACEQCAVGSYSALGSTACQVCQPGYYCSVNDGLCDQKPCSAGTYQPNIGQTTCLLCPPGTTSAKGSAQYSPITCPPGTYRTQANPMPCVPCALGFYSTTYDSMDCQPCPAGYYCAVPVSLLNISFLAEGNTDAYCGGFLPIPCPAGTYQNATGQYTCILTSLGSFTSTNASTSQTICPAGSYCSQPSSSFVRISPSFVLVGGVSICSTKYGGGSFSVSCPVGTYQPNVNSSTCLYCEAGSYYNSTSECVPCTIGSYCTRISSCDTGLVGPGIVDCPVGTFQNLTGQSNCQLCPLGSFWGSSNSTFAVTSTLTINSTFNSCQPCPAGYYCAQPVSVLDISPSLLTGGTMLDFVLFGGVSPLPCPPGTYQPLTGMSSCTLCNLGTYSSWYGSPQCQQCPAGSYCIDYVSSFIHNYTILPFLVFGGSLIDPTPTLYYGGTFPRPCPAGSAQPNRGSSSCQFCDSGSYYNHSTADQCDLCPKGYYCVKPMAIPLFDTAAIMPCLAGTYQNVSGQSSCVICPLGTYSNSSSLSITSCQLCEAGFYCIQPVADLLLLPSTLTGGTVIDAIVYGGSSVMIPCPPGTYQPNASQSTCLLCEPGTYSSTFAAATPCSLLCDRGFYCAQPASDIFILPFLLAGGVSLNSASYGGGFSPQPCPNGTYQNLTGSSTCQLCELGTYTHSQQMTECDIICGPGHYCAQPTSSISSMPSSLLTGGTLLSSPFQTSSILYSGGPPTPCPPGTYQNASKQGTCILIDVGTYWFSATTTFQCPVGHYCAQSASNLSISTYLLVGGISYSNAVYGGSSTAVKCPPGTKQPSLGSSTCLLCDVGFTSSNNSTSCSLCSAGSYCYQPLVQLDPVLLVSLKSQSNITSFGLAEACPIGTFQPNAGASTCQLCDLGYTTASQGATHCTLCLQGSYCAQSASPLLNVLPSLYGGSSIMNQTQNINLYGGHPIPCPPPTFQPNVGQSACNQCGSNNGTTACSLGPPCASGEYLLNGTCYLCPPGTFSQPGSSLCTPCDDGYYQPAAGQGSCLPCPFMTNSTQASISNATDGNIPAGIIMCSLNRGVSSSYLCPPGFGSSYAGSASSYSTCLECPAGTFSTGTALNFSAYIVPCQVCLEGTYQPLSGQSSCVSCPSGTFSSYTNKSSPAPLPNCNLCQGGSVQLLMGQTSCAACSLPTTNGAYECVSHPSSVHTYSVGAPHFVGFDGSSFAFSGESDRVYNLYSASDLLVNAHFSLVKDPSHYPEYDSPTWMDSIAVMFANHSFVFDVYDVPLHRPTVDGLRMPSMILGARYGNAHIMAKHPEADRNDNKNINIHDGDGSDSGYAAISHTLAQANISFTMAHDNGLVLTLALGSEYRVNVSLHNDNWFELYMKVHIQNLETLSRYRYIVAGSSDSRAYHKPSDGIVGQTRHHPDSFYNGALVIDSVNGDNDIDAVAIGVRSMASTEKLVAKSHSQFWLDRLKQHSDKFKITDTNLLSTNFEANLYQGILLKQKNSTRSSLLFLNDASSVLFDFHGAEAAHTLFESKASLMQVDARVMRFAHRYRRVHVNDDDDEEQALFGISSVNVRVECAADVSGAPSFPVSLQFSATGKLLTFAGFDISIPGLESRHTSWSTVVATLSYLLLRRAAAPSPSWRVDYFQEHDYPGSESLAIRRLQVNNVELRLHLLSATLCVRPPGARGKANFSGYEINSKRKAPIHDDDDDGTVLDHGYLYTGPVYHKFINGDYDGDCLVVLRMSQKFDSMDQFVEVVLIDNRTK